jgi:hypothetical protein
VLKPTSEPVAQAPAPDDKVIGELGACRQPADEGIDFAKGRGRTWAWAWRRDSAKPPGAAKHLAIYSSFQPEGFLEPPERPSGLDRRFSGDRNACDEIRPRAAHDAHHIGVGGAAVIVNFSIKRPWSTPVSA